MPQRKQIKPGQVVPLGLTEAERRLLLDDLLRLDETYAQAIRSTPPGQPLGFTLDDWEDLGGLIAAEANHTEDKKREKKLERLLGKINDLLDEFADEEPLTTLKVFQEEDGDATGDAATLAEYAASMLSIADYICGLQHLDPVALKSAPSAGLKLTAAERTALVEQTSLSDELKSRLRATEGGEQTVQVSLNDLAAICFSLSEALAANEDDLHLAPAAANAAECLANALREALLPKQSQKAQSKRRSARGSASAAQSKGAPEPKQATAGPDLTLPVTLTLSQRKAIAEAADDLGGRLKIDQPNPRTIRFTLEELKSITRKCRQAHRRAPTGAQQNLLAHVVAAMEEAVTEFKQHSIAAVPPSKRLYQLKITLKDIDPPVWRQIQIKDCTLDQLHRHIQVAMGWEDCHLYQFTIDGVEYGNLCMLDGQFEDWKDSCVARLSEVIPRDKKRFKFDYQYDFGDGWEHEVLWEGCLRAEKGVRYPVCLEGKRACPPEDVGGPWGYYHYLEALADPNHEEHEDFLEWSGPFDPEAFDAQAVTKGMRRGW